MEHNTFLQTAETSTAPKKANSQKHVLSPIFIGVKSVYGLCVLVKAQKISRGTLVPRQIYYTQRWCILYRDCGGGRYLCVWENT